MKEIIEKVKKYKTVSNGYQEIKRYQADDGTIFNTKSAAEKCDVFVAYNKKFDEIKHADCGYDTWYYPINEEQIEMLRQRFGKEHKNINVCEWISFEYFDGGDYADYYTLHSFYEEREDFKRLCVALNIEF
jgi:hypothetical protein